MQFDLTEREQEVLEKLGWRLVDIANDDRRAYVEIENWSPAGEDLCEMIDVDEWDTFATATRKWAQSFDEEEHVELYVGMRGKQGVHSTIRELVDDAEAIQAMFNDLADAIEAIYDELDVDEDKEGRTVRTYRVPLVWQMFGSVEVEARNKEEAIRKALFSPEVPLPEGTYVDSSLEVDDSIQIEVRGI